ncbi:siderophore-interacting protein [Echinicola sp. 20G]|uniref:siderophore-interacting protein n=1 Tax=Echinicola sp. 20G TaxID=2781961 RepID=UPI0019102406|nr:siderophore-interacting protein [Echinicola sp. 20G]
MRENNEDRAAPKIMSGILKVKSRTLLTPHYIRLILEGEHLKNFSMAQVGDNNKLLIPTDPAVPMQLPLAPKSKQENGAAGAIVRTYTLRDLNTHKGEMTVDFVAHGENGPASKWALNAKKGDQIGVLMKMKGKELYMEADFYALIGDHTALPVISVILSQLPSDAKGVAIIEVPGPEDTLTLEKPENISVSWIYNPTPEKGSSLFGEVERIDFPKNLRKFVFSAGEFHSIKVIQNYFRNSDFLRHEWRAYSYWKAGQSEDKSSADRAAVAHRGN